MDDTPLHVKQIQLEIWLSKPPMERLRLTLQHNDELFSLWNGVKKNQKKNDLENPPAK